MTKALSLSQLNTLVGRALAEAPLQNVCVVAELSDLRVNHGHCYMELIEKDAATGSVNARLRAVIWASSFSRINADFFSATGRRLESGLKVMACGSVNYHSAYGLSFVISGIDPSYTMGEAERRRREIIMRLTREGVIDLNRSLEWPDVALRIAVISAKGAAGYGDFIHQLYTNRRHLRFTTRLYPALMQGREAPGAIISALEEIAADEELWDGVVIIRGGGATSDLAAFENYDLAANIAQFPLPVIIGIGHERDVTVLDYVANMRVKTPTAAAEWLIGRGAEALDRLDQLASEIHHTASSMISGAREQLSYISATLPHLPATALKNSARRLDRCTMALTETVRGRLRPRLSQLDMISERIPALAAAAVERQKSRLDSASRLLEVLSPMATLKRGYSITRVGGRAVTSVAGIPSGSLIETTLADGTVISTAQ